MSICIITENMTRTPSNSNSSDRLDRIEAILERFIEESDRTNKVVQQLIESQIQTDKAINQMIEIQASLAAGQEKQERLLEYLIRRLEVGNG
jgi:predicted transcriptional regulator